MSERNEGSGSEQSQKFRQSFLRENNNSEKNSNNAATTAGWKRERIKLYEKRFRNEKEDLEEDSETNSSLFGWSIFNRSGHFRTTTTSGFEGENNGSGKYSSRTAATEKASKRGVGGGSRWIGNFHKYGSARGGDGGDGDGGGGGDSTTPRSLAGSSSSPSSVGGGTKSSSVSSPRLAGIEEDAIHNFIDEEEEEDLLFEEGREIMNNTNENTRTKKSSMRPPTAAGAGGSSSPRESDGKTSAKSVTFGLPKTMSEKEQKRYERKRAKEMSKYLEETTKALYSEEEVNQNDGDDKSLYFSSLFFRDFDGSSGFGCLPRTAVVFAMIAKGSFAFGGVSYALFDPRGNAKVFGDIDNEDDGNDNAFRAIALFGGVLGAILSGYLSDHAIGRKTVLSLSPGIAATLWSFFFGVSNSNGSLCDAPPFVPVLFACLSGMTCASWYSVAPVLLAETAPAQIRGRAFVLCIGLASILGAFTIGEILKLIQPDDGSSDKFYVVLLVLAFMVTCMGTFIAAIESPRWLLSRGRVIDAQHSCAKMNGSNAIDSLHEMQDIKTDLDRTSPEGSTSRFLWFDLISKTKLSLATIVCSCLIVIQTFGTSSFYMFTYDETDEGVNNAYLYAYLSMLVGIVVCAFRVGETKSGGFLPRGRKSLLVASFFILALANGVRFIVAVVDDDGDIDEDSVKDVKASVIVFCNCFGAFGYGVGASFLPLLFASEWFPQHARQAAVASAAAFLYGVFLLASITEEATMTLLGDILVFLVKAIVCVLGVVVALYSVHDPSNFTLEMALYSESGGNLIRDENDYPDDDDVEKNRQRSNKKAYEALLDHARNAPRYSSSGQSLPLRVKTGEISPRTYSK